ncbi:MAG TPA: hypothetical protein VM262_19640, partial [Acidimicrobiales bacterium]|nr:hypothetical protein [Acidimicrobiales bacterium]
MARNRVTPFGTIEDLRGRGLLMGNRGILHEGREIRRRWASTAWIACVLEFKGWRAPQWARGHYTPLFFLDEATALAAGHRPCALCQRADHRRFRTAWGEMPLPEIDATLHRERTGERPVVAAADLTDGAMVAVDGTAHLVLGGALRPWSMTGYGPPLALPATVTLLTPA